MIDAKLLALLVCPACGGNVIEKNHKIECVKCQRKYPIENGVPVLLANQAEK